MPRLLSITPGRGDLYPGLDRVVEEIERRTGQRLRNNPDLTYQRYVKTSRGLLGVPVPGKVNVAVLEQPDVWVDVKGKVHRIDRIDKSYCENILRYCYRKWGWIVGEDVIEGKPLIQALKKRLAGKYNGSLYYRAKQRWWELRHGA